MVKNIEFEEQWTESYLRTEELKNGDEGRGTAGGSEVASRCETTVLAMWELPGDGDRVSAIRFYLHRLGLLTGCRSRRNKPVVSPRYPLRVPAVFRIFFFISIRKNEIRWDTSIPRVSRRIPVLVQYPAPIRCRIPAT